MIRRIAAVAGLALVVVSLSGAEAQPTRIDIAVPAPYFEAAGAPPGAAGAAVRPLPPDAPRWASRLYERSARVLLALTDPDTGAQIAGVREGWDHVWPRDAAAGAIGLRAAGLRAEADRVAGFLADLDLDRAARFDPSGEPLPGRSPAGDAAGWVAAAAGEPPGGGSWRDHQDYGENVTGDLLGNAIAAGAPADEVRRLFLTPRGLVREPGSDALDSAAAWAVVPFDRAGLREPARRTLLALARGSSKLGIAPTEDWSPDQAWTAPTAWSAWALVRLGEISAADRLLTELRRAATPAGTLPERVAIADGHPTSTTPVAWSHAFAILALRARYRG